MGLRDWFCGGNKKPRIAYFCRFPRTLDRGGGISRSLQVLSYVEAFDAEFHTPPQAKEQFSRERRRRLRKGPGSTLGGKVFAGTDLSLWSEERRPNIYRLGEIAAGWAESLPDLKRLDAAFIDDPIYFLPLFECLHSLGIPVIAVAQNIESLSTPQIAPGATLSLLSTELGLFQRSRLVIAISIEEDFLLTNVGARSFYLPYHPVEPFRSRLLAVRARRASAPKRGVLALGSGHNIPSREGLVLAAQWWREQRLEREAGPLWIAGKRTDEYLDPALAGEGVELLGSLDDESLERKMTEASCALVVQANGSGALTRICDLLVAGVPVAATMHAARSYHGALGLFEFRGEGNLAAAIRNASACGPFPAPEPPDPEPLLAEIRRILGKDSPGARGGT